MIEKHQNWMALANAMYEQSIPKAQAVICHGWGDLHEELIALVAKMYFDSKARYVALNSLEEYQVGKPGFTHWQRQLKEKYGLPEGAVVAAGAGLQTKEEAEVFADFMQQHNLSSAILISSPMHIMRAFLTNLEIAKQKNMAVQFFPRTITGVNWEQQILIRGLTDPNANEQTNRLGRLVGECARIINYRHEYENGNKNFAVASISEGLKHLNL